MKLRNIHLIFSVIILAILCLIGIQFFWFKNQYQANREELHFRIKEVLHKTSAELKDKNYCFEIHSRVYIKPDEGFVMLKPRKNLNEKSEYDTIPMFYTPSESFPAGMFNNFLFTHHVTADVSVKFEYHLSDTLPFTFASKLLSENTNTKNIREIVATSSPVFKLFDTTYVDSVLRTSFKKEGIPGFAGFGLINGESNELVYSSSGSNKSVLLSSPHRLRLNDNLFFSKPYDLSVEIMNEDRYLMGKITGILIASAVILLILISGFWYFLVTIRKQKKLSDMKSDFINNMTHEFNTPLSNISLASETLIKTQFRDNEKNIRYMAIIGAETDRLVENVNRILQVAQTEKNKLILKPEPLKLHQLLQHVMQTFELRSDLGQVALTPEFKATNDKVKADETHIINVFFNIIDNAIKYGSDADRKVVVKTMNQNGSIIVMVDDNGIGMSKEAITKVFDKFYREQGGNRHDIKGFGLGLTYAKSIVEAHHGKIWAQSEEGKGTKLFVELETEKN